MNQEDSSGILQSEGDTGRFETDQQFGLLYEAIREMEVRSDGKCEKEAL